MENLTGSNKLRGIGEACAGRAAIGTTEQKLTEFELELDLLESNSGALKSAVHQLDMLLDKITGPEPETAENDAGHPIDDGLLPRLRFYRSEARDDIDRLQALIDRLHALI